MQRTIFNVDDIHRLRVETAERYAKMSPEDAKHDRRQNAEETLRAIEKIRASKEMKHVTQTLQTYKARFEGGQIIPLGDPAIPEGSELIVTILEETPDNVNRRQRKAVNDFLEDIRNCDEPLGADFDEALNQ